VGSHPLHGPIEALTTWRATYSPPQQLLLLVAAVGGFHVASTFDPILKRTRPLLKAFRNRVSYTSILLGAIGGILAYYSAGEALLLQLGNGSWMTIMCASALAAPIVAAIQLGALGLARLSFKRARGRPARRTDKALVSAQPLMQT
jgi:hypothetical protein